MAGEQEGGDPVVPKLPEAAVTGPPGALVSLPGRRRPSSEEQPALPLDLSAPEPATPRGRRSRSRARGEAPVQLTLGLAEEDHEEEPEEREDAHYPAPPMLEPEPSSRVLEAGPPIEYPERFPAEESLPPDEPEPADFDPDPFAEIPGFARAVTEVREFVLLPGSLRGRLDLRELSRYVASLTTVVKDWEGAPEIEDGGIRLRGSEGGAWIYPETNRVRLATDGAVRGPVGEDLIALCRWLEARAGMRLYPAGETRGAGADRSLDPWETFS
jgi:hypothetical protein